MKNEVAKYYSFSFLSFFPDWRVIMKSKYLYVNSPYKNIFIVVYHGRFLSYRLGTIGA